MTTTFKKQFRKTSQGAIRIPGKGTHNSGVEAKAARWIPTTCSMCYNHCSVQVLVRDGVATAIEGLPGAPPNHGKMCAKGKSGLVGLYSPNRVSTPLKRTNPKKGVDVDPMWEEISWEQAMETITAKFVDSIKRNPEGVSVNTFDWPGATSFSAAFLASFGGTQGGTIPTSSNMFCGRAVHPVAFMLSGSSDQQPDFDYCKYLLVIGGGYGTGTGTHAMHMAKGLANARVNNGLKMIVVDPCRNASGARADEWVPIIPGTDTAFCLAIVNTLINDLDIYDEEFLSRYTNAPYMIMPDGHYARDEGTGEPLVLSKSSGKLIAHNKCKLNDALLEGQTEFKKQKVTTAFSLFREHLKLYTCEFASGITSIPASTIRRIAKEFGEASQVGAKVTIDGVTLPLRPASVHWYRGIGQHQHGLNNGWAAALIALTVGAVDVPGGHCGTEATGPWGLPIAGKDGIITHTNPFREMGFSMPPRPAYFDPNDPTLQRMFPATIGTSSMVGVTVRIPEKFNMTHKPEILFCSRSNPVKGTGKPEQIAEILRKIPFQVSFVQHHEETSQFADIILPDTHYLERLIPFSRDPYSNFIGAPSPDDLRWDFAIQQPVIKPIGESRNWIEVLWDLAHRAGIAEDLYSVINISLQLKPGLKLERGKRYTFREFSDAWIKSWCGTEFGLDYFEENGWAPSSEERTVKDRYPRIFHDGRIPLYLEHWIDAGNQIQQIVTDQELEWGDLSDYSPLVSFKECWASNEGGDDFPLYLVSTKLGFLTLNTSSIKNPHLQEIASAAGEAYKIGIHPDIANRLSIENGDIVEIEGASGRKTLSTARITRDVHPKVIMAPGNVVHLFTKNSKKEIAQGIHLNSFIPFQLERMDMVSGALDACVKVKIRKIRKGG